MTRKFIPVEESFRSWQQDPEFRAAYAALDDEFALASALLRARNAAGMTQAEVAQAMGTTQAVVARLESGRTLPSTRTLTRFAHATHTRLRITFEPADAAGKPAVQSAGHVRQGHAGDRRSGVRKRVA